MNFRTGSYVLILMLLFFFTSSSIGKETFPDKVQAALKTLGPKNSFAYYDLQLLDQEIKVLRSLKINATEEYNNYGNLKALESEVKEFIQSLSPQNDAYAEPAAQIIGKIVQMIVQGSGTETAWVSVRSFVPTPEYDLPRWHTDGYYYEPRTGNPYKFALTLKGPPTLFYRLAAAGRDAFSALQRKGTEKNEYNRQALATLLGQFRGNIAIPQPHQGAVFIVGSDNAAVHSEPPIHEERLFISVLPGSHAQIKEWKEQ